jgi:hypothetical protein
MEAFLDFGLLTTGIVWGVGIGVVGLMAYFEEKDFRNMY